MRRAWSHTLPPQHLQPARELKQVFRGTENSRGLAEQLHLVPQGIGYRHVPASIPERVADSIVGVVVQDDEVADVFVLRDRNAVELATPLLKVAGMRKQQDQSLDGDLDDVNGGRLERLDEATGETHANHVAIPQQLAAAGG